MKPHGHMPKTRASPRLIPLATPQRIHVRSDAQGRPLAVARRRHWIAVEAERERWRVDDEWWRTRISRRYHVLALADGTLLTVYQDRITQQWFAQR
jgi:hypothetical protein